MGQTTWRVGREMVVAAVVVAANAAPASSVGSGAIGLPTALRPFLSSPLCP